MKTKLTILAIVFAAFMFSSCDVPVSLGKRLNLDPPVVLIERPDFMEDANQFMTIEGTATDNEEVVYLFLTVEQVVKEGTASWKYDWRSERGAWKWRNAQGVWENINVNDALTTETDWDKLAGRNNIRWSITLDVSGLENGEYIISANAENNVKNTGAIEQRRFIVDHDPPLVTIKAPVLEIGNSVDVFDKLEKYELQDPAVLDQLHNERITVQYEIEDDFSIAALVFQLYDNGGNCYYNADGKDVTELGFELGWSGKIEIDEIEIDEPIVGDYPLFLQLISIASDKAGNEKKYTHGWLVWWPEADLPWVTGVGVEVETDAVTNARTYPGSDVQGQAYDDDGVARVEYRLYSTTRNPDKIHFEHGKEFTGTLENKPLVENTAPSAFFSWSFKAPEESGVYKVEIDCWDIDDVPGHTITRYFYVYALESQPLLMSIGGSPTGTYSQGDDVVIELILREPVTVDETLGTPTLTLVGFSGSLTTRTTTSYHTDGNKMVFTYTIPADENDNADLLEFSEISLNGATITGADGADVTGDLPLTGWEDRVPRLSTVARITIDTRVPKFVPVGSGLSADGTLLTLNFDKPIYKRQGNITITQTGDYHPPAVMEKADFLRWGGIAGSTSTGNIGYYYEVGTNGTDSVGNVDTSEKYILKYNIDPANTSGEADDLRTLLKNMKAHIREIPVVSPKVTINASDRMVMTVDLGPDSGFELRVKGVSYDVTIDGGLVQDQEGKPTVGDSEILNQAISGVNRPFIRVDRASARTGVTQGLDTEVTVGGESNTTEVTRSFWVRNVPVVSTADTNPPTASGTWRSVGEFTINLNAAPPDAQSYFTHGDTLEETGIRIGAAAGTPVPTPLPDNFITATQIQGEVFRNGDNGFIGWNSPSGGGWTQIVGQGNGNLPYVAVNPYMHNIDWNRTYNEGDFVVENNRAWVNIENIAPEDQQEGGDLPPDTTGWLRYTYTETETTWTGGDSYTIQTVNVTQPYQAWVRIDTQTPGADISYTINEKVTAPQRGDQGTLFDGSSHPAPVTVTMPTAAAAETTNPFRLGVTNNTNGLLYGIAAMATKGGVNSPLSYEKVSRSVIAFNDIAQAGNWGDLQFRAADNNLRQLHLWVRGGDGLSGDSLTPGFPLQWSDKAKGGAGLLSGPDNGLKYWISWEISVPAYFHFIAGTTGSAAEATNGPLDWGWAKNSWSFQHHRYPLHPGGSMYFVVGGESSLVVNSATQYFEFYDTGFSGSR